MEGGESAGAVTFSLCLSFNGLSMCTYICRCRRGEVQNAWQLVPAPVCTYVHHVVGDMVGGAGELCVGITSHHVYRALASRALAGLA